MARSARLLDLIQALRRHRRPVAAADLAAETGVSLRTLYRDIVTLKAQGAPIEGEAGLGYVLQPGYLLPPLMFEYDEIDAIILGLRLVAQRGDEALAAAAADALAKVVAVLPPAMEDVVATSGLLAGGREVQASPNVAAIRAAIRAEERLHIGYTDKKGRQTERAVWPVAIGFFEAAEVMAAWCEARGDFRHFRLDRITAVASTGSRFPKRHRVLLAEWRLAQDLDSLM